MITRFRKRSIRVVWLLAGGAAVFLLLQTPLFTVVRHRAWDIWVTHIASLFHVGALSVSQDVQGQLNTLRAENVRLHAEALDYRHLRQQLGSPAFADFRTIPAEIVGRPIDTFHSRLVLNQGTTDGIIVGAPVVLYGSILVGFVSDLSEHTATLQLLVHPETAVAAESVDDEHPGRGLAQGTSFTAVALKTVPRDVVLHEGQPVVTQARPGVMPYGLLIGHIRVIDNKEHEPYQQARLLLPYRLDELRAVHILVSP